MNYKQSIATQLSPHLPNIAIEEIAAAIEQPADPKMGHFAYPCFKLAKTLRKAPPVIAAELAAATAAALPPWLQAIEPVGGYLNFYLTRSHFAETVLQAVLHQPLEYGNSNIGAGKVVLIDYSSPNIAKHFHVGHLGTTVIGRALYNIFKFQGYETIGINYLGDWGTSFGKLLTAYLKWGDKAEIEQTGLVGLTSLYVRFHEESEKSPEMAEELESTARNWVVKMENGDEQGLEIWRWICNVSMQEYQKIYQRLGISFESYRGESYYNDKMTASVDELRSKNLLTESEGALVVELEDHKMPPCLIVRRDGGTLYATRDITAAIDRHKTYNFHKSLYVTGTEQKLHFSQFFKVLELMGYSWAKDMLHINYGLFIFDAGKMSTRKGQVIKMANLLDEATAKTLDIIQEKSPNLENKAEVAEQVGIGAIIFNQMYNSRIKDAIFSWERMLNFEGETGPYVQYSHARACSVLEKAGLLDKDTEPNPQNLANYQNFYLPAKIPQYAELLTDDESFEILRLIYNFPEKIAEAAEKYEPFIISRFLVALAQAFNKFYNTHQVLTGDEVQVARLTLVFAAKTVIASGLALLGIAAPKKM
ncbi:MAG: arginine--tRNA ligase [Defluviitaleaceae bacterium]|nr:arginine--tRNA ligase [Defluviitaleaceae bacterium]